MPVAVCCNHIADVHVFQEKADYEATKNNNIHRLTGHE